MKYLIGLGLFSAFVLGATAIYLFVQSYLYLSNEDFTNQSNPNLTVYREYVFNSSSFSFELNNSNLIIKKLSDNKSINLENRVFAHTDFSLFGKLTNTEFIPSTNCAAFAIKYNITTEKIDNFRCTN